MTSEQTYLWIGVASTFATVVLVGVRLITTSRTRQASAVLQGHLQTAGIAVTASGDAPGVGQRVIKPAIGRLAAWIRRVTPVGMRDDVARKLSLAGQPRFWTAELFVAFTAATTVGGVALGWWLGTGSDHHVLGILWVPLLGYFGFAFPRNRLAGVARRRQDSIRRDLADTIDLLTISVEAGLAFDAALLHVRRVMHGPLSDEIGRMLHEMQLGARRVDAMRHFSERTDVDELRSFVLAMTQADVFGVSVANVLRAQSVEMRTKRRQYAEEKAMKTPVKLLFPMILCILPSLLVLIVGPGWLRISQVFSSHATGGGLFGP
jgi:tight adherence protein C